MVSRKELLESSEVRYYHLNLIACVLVLIVILLISIGIFFSGNLKNFEVGMYSAVLFFPAVFAFGGVIYYIYRIKLILDILTFKLYEVEFNDMEVVKRTAKFNFTILVNGELRYVSTRPIFSGYRDLFLKTNAYYREKGLIAYDIDTDTVVIIKKI